MLSLKCQVYNYRISSKNKPYTKKVKYYMNFFRHEICFITIYAVCLSSYFLCEFSVTN